MPVEIKELIVRVAVNENNFQIKERNATLLQKEKKELLDECVHKVLEVLERRRER